jgi:hypothetical protein
VHQNALTRNKFGDFTVSRRFAVPTIQKFEEWTDMDEDKKKRFRVHVALVGSSTILVIGISVLAFFAKLNDPPMWLYTAQALSVSGISCLSAAMLAQSAVLPDLRNTLKNLRLVFARRPGNRVYFIAGAGIDALFLTVFANSTYRDFGFLVSGATILMSVFFVASAIGMIDEPQSKPE